MPSWIKSLFASIKTLHARLVGWRTIIVNIGFALVDTALMLDWTPIVHDAETLSHIVFAQALINGVMRFYTRGPIGMNPNSPPAPAPEPDPAYPNDPR